MLDEIIRIGSHGVVGDDDIKNLLPNLPNLLGSEYIFTIDWKTIVAESDETIDHIIKGLHYIELEYRRRTSHDFGFGSPSQTYPLLERYVNKNAGAAKALWNWIRDRGGNYYIPRCKLLTEEELRKNSEQARLEIDQIRSARRLARLEEVRPKQIKHESRVRRDRLHRERLERMDVTSLLSQLAPRPIYFYGPALESIAVISEDDYELLLEVIDVQEKIKPTRARRKLLRRLRELANAFRSEEGNSLTEK